MKRDTEANTSNGKTIIKFLHWTPLGLVTVPLFELFSDSDEKLGWFLVNGLVMGVYVRLLIYGI